jgi:hypothetical protein
MYVVKMDAPIRERGEYVVKRPSVRRVDPERFLKPDDLRFEFRVRRPAASFAATVDKASAVNEHRFLIADAPVAGDAVTEYRVESIVVFDTSVVGLLRAVRFDSGAEPPRIPATKTRE